MQNERVKDLTEKFLNGITDVIRREVELEVRQRLASAFGNGKAVKPAAKAGPRRRIDMACRWPECKNRSKGPRFHFMCEEHLSKFNAKQKRQEKAAKEA